METRANNVTVGIVTLALLALVAAFIVWIARFGEGTQKQYDIFFKQSVDGLSKGSEVSFSGVPVGQVQKIELWRADPTYKRVRISIKDDVPILLGTTATLQGSFTGVSDILLDGAVKGAPPLSQPGPEGVPVIPPKAGGLGALLSNAPLLLERLSTLTDRFNTLLNDQNQKSITNILAHSDKISGDLADATPQLKATVADLQVTIRQASQTLAAFQGVASRADNLLGNQGDSLAAQMRETLNSAKKAADELQGALADARPGLKDFSGTTLPAADAAMRDLRETSKSLRDITEKIQDQGAGSLFKGHRLPDYKP
jgi:phospholipid/cholesterol/gamma-HCH transport system substrate-binding protein